MSSITINNITLDPKKSQPALRSLGLENHDASQTNFVLIQCIAPLTLAQKMELEALGADLLEYVPENTYIARYPGNNLTPVAGLDFVVWVNPYLRNFKVPVALSATHPDALFEERAIARATAPIVSADPKKVDIVLHRSVDASVVRQKIAEVAGVDLQGLPAQGPKIRLILSPEKIRAVAELDEVRHVEEVVPPRLFNDQALKILRCAPLHAAGGLRGEGEVIAVCDTGFDTGSLHNVHPSFAGRVARLYPLGRANSDDPDGHGTHVAGSAVGGSVPGANSNVLGAAPAAKLVVQSVLDSGGGLNGIPQNLEDLFRAPYDVDQARVHTNSWGAPVGGRYTQEAFEVDRFVWENRDLVVCFAAGNDGADVNANGVVDNGSVGSPATAKNCISVGACENDRPAEPRVYGYWARFPVAPLSTDRVADNPNGLAAFSSRGPTRDGRIKPDLVAPGTCILSAHSRNAKVGPFWGSSIDPNFAYMGGTSMATPLVAGCAALARQLLRTKYGIAPSAALVKALLVNGAQNLPGQYIPSEAGATPNFAEGFGRVDMTSIADASGSGKLFIWDEATELATGAQERRAIDVPQVGLTAKVTLVWTDPPGETLQNDLDLIVQAGDAVVHGNRPVGSQEFDRRNNVEQIVLSNLQPGRIEIVVHAFRTALYSQDYALVTRLY